MMQALRFEQGKLRVGRVDQPAAVGECLVRVVRSGICNTDLEIVRGYAGFSGTIGHEFAGVVESAPADEDLIGRRVVGEINVGCGVCELCRTGDERHCPQRTVLGIKDRDGAHAEFLTLPARNLFEIPENVTDDEAVFVEPLAAAYGITEQVDVQPGTRVAVIGDGKLGILCVRSLLNFSRNVVLIGKHPEKLKLGERSGAESVLAADAGKRERYFDVVVEASGSKSGFATALDIVKPRGKIVLKSTFHGTPKWEASRVVVDEISVIGSRCGRFAPALELLASRKVEVSDLVSEVFRLEDGVRAVETAGASGVLKVLLNNG
jgi:threonine dehydrogenase-like Zn-dependent dehydrogenase